VDNDEVKEDDEDDEMQLQISAKTDNTNNTTVNSSSTITPLLPLTAKVTKECDGSISTSNETDTTNSRVGSTVHMGNSTTTKLLSENITSEKNVLRFETDKPINFLTDIETDAVFCIVTEHIYPTCQFIAQVDHMDSATCFIFHKIGYRRPDQGKERSKWWACTTKLVIDSITLLWNRTLDRYRSVAKGKVYVVVLLIYITIESNMKIDIVLLQEGSPLPESDDISTDITNFLNTATMTPRLFWFTMKVMKAITNSLWEPWKKKIDDYYTKVNAHDEAMGLWALHYVRSEKMIKMEVSKEELDDNIEMK